MKKEDLLASIKNDFNLSPEDLLSLLNKRVALKREQKKSELEHP